MEEGNSWRWPAVEGEQYEEGDDGSESSYVADGHHGRRTFFGCGRARAENLKPVNDAAVQTDPEKPLGPNIMKDAASATIDWDCVIWQIVSEDREYRRLPSGV